MGLGFTITKFLGKPMVGHHRNIKQVYIGYYRVSKAYHPKKHVPIIDFHESMCISGRTDLNCTTSRSRSTLVYCHCDVSTLNLFKFDKITPCNSGRSDLNCIHLELVARIKVLKCSVCPNNLNTQDMIVKNPTIQVGST